MLTQWKEAIGWFCTHQMSDAELSDWQNTALQNVVAHVKDKSPFYRKHFAGIDPTTMSLETLQQLPFTTKDHLREAMYDMVSGDIRDAAYFCSTTGTTGRATPCPRSALDVELNNVSSVYSIRDIIRECFGENHKPIFTVLAPNELHSVATNMTFVSKELGICKLDLFPLSPVVGFKRLFEVLLELKVDMLLCSPGLMMGIAEMAEAYGYDVKEDLYVRCVLCTGELCTPSMAALVERTWGCKVYNFMYGSQEAGCMAVADRQGRLVPLSTNYIFEVLDITTGQPKGYEGYGELCVTALVPGLKPLLRYKTDDIVRVSRNDDGTQRIEVLGRIKDMVEIVGKRWSAAELDAKIIEAAPEIFSYQIQLNTGSNGDEVLVRIKPKEDSDYDLIKVKVQQLFIDEICKFCTVEIHPLLDMTSATGAWVSWKSARIKDTRTDTSRDIETLAARELAKVAEERI